MDKDLKRWKIYCFTPPCTMLIAICECYPLRHRELTISQTMMFNKLEVVRLALVMLSLIPSSFQRAYLNTNFFYCKKKY